MFILRYILLIASFLFAISSFSSWANCNVVTGAYTFNPGQVIVQRDAPVGSTLTNVMTGSTILAYTNCNNMTNGSYIGIKSYLSYHSQNAQGYNIYSTNIPGVGAIIGGTGSAINNCNFYWTGWVSKNNASASIWYGANELGLAGCTATSGNAHQGTLLMQLVKIGNIISGNFYGTIGAFYAKDWNSSNLQAEIPISFSGGSVIQVMCSIKTPSLIFPIGDVLADKFGSSVGTIPPGAQNTQNLGLDCDAGANINVMLQGAKNPDVASTSVLSLTGQGNSDVAKGVGVQLLYNGTPLVLNNRIVLKKSAGGQEMFPITARYYQTKTSVSTGKANAAATLDLTYQ